jgi:hypothetical protein
MGIITRLSNFMRGRVSLEYATSVLGVDDKPTLIALARERGVVLQGDNTRKYITKEDLERLKAAEKNGRLTMLSSLGLRRGDEIKKAILNGQGGLDYARRDGEDLLLTDGQVKDVKNYADSLKKPKVKPKQRERCVVILPENRDRQKKYVYASDLDEKVHKDKKSGVEYLRSEESQGLLLRVFEKRKGIYRFKNAFLLTVENPQPLSFENSDEGDYKYHDISKEKEKLGIAEDRRHFANSRSKDMASLGTIMDGGEAGYRKSDAVSRLGITEEDVENLVKKGIIKTGRASNQNLLYSRKSVNHLTARFDSETLIAMARSSEIVTTKYA